MSTPLVIYICLFFLSELLPYLFILSFDFLSDFLFFPTAHSNLFHFILILFFLILPLFTSSFISPPLISHLLGVCTQRSTLLWIRRTQINEVQKSYFGRRGVRGCRGRELRGWEREGRRKGWLSREEWLRSLSPLTPVPSVIFFSFFGRVYKSVSDDISNISATQCFHPPLTKRRQTQDWLCFDRETLKQRCGP